MAGIRDAISAEYQVDPMECERDILSILQELAAEGLIEMSRAAPSQMEGLCGL